MHPDNLQEMSTTANLIHISFNSAIFGFIDDLFMKTELYSGTSPLPNQNRLITLQSQLRMGSYDFEQNYFHVKTILDCLNQTFNNASTTPAPCSE